MKINLLDEQKNYPCVLLPVVVIDHITKRARLEDLFTVAGIVLPEKPIIRTKTIWDVDLKGYISLTKHEYDLDRIKRLNIFSREIDLEYGAKMEYGDYEIPRMPVFEEYQKVKDNRKLRDIIVDYVIVYGFVLFVSLFFCLALIGPFLMLFTDFDYSNGTFILAMIGASIFFWVVFCYYSFKKQYPNYKKKKMEAYRTVTKRIGTFEENRIALEKYKTEVIDIYNKATSEYESEIKKLESEVKKRRNELEITILNKHLDEDKIDLIPVENTKRGRTELFFLQYLYNEFKTNVKIDLAPDMHKPFQPDYILEIPSLNLTIDVEIDEPYVLGSGEIIHHERTRDSDRNNFFISNNWIVIRFSEKQIVKTPAECVKYIKDVISAIEQKNTSLSTNIEIERQWSYEEAILMKEQKVRENYLKEMK